MVAKANITAAAKRKKTEEMAESPPKRVTRARTAKVTEDVEIPSKATKASKAPAKGASEKNKAPVKSSATQKKAPASKRRTRTEDEVEALIEESAPEPEVAQEPKPKPATVRGGRRKPSAPVGEARPKIIGTPKPQGQQTKAAAAEKPKTTTSTRGRPKKEQLAKTIEQPEIVDPTEAAEPVKRATRGRAATTTKADAPKATTRTRTTKKVQFQDEVDKENIPVEMEASKKTARSTMKPTGIRAKPVRKPASTRPSTRGRKAVKDQEDNDQEQLPLSPKKVNQVAKAGSASSEDELAGEKTPITSPSKSPLKFQTSPVRVRNATMVPSSPSKSSSANTLASPARRPPPSPFKDGLKLSPKKVDINFSVEKPVFQSTLNKTPAKSSLLQESPRKVKLQNSVVHPTLAASQSPMKASLLQSPARRPTASPFKSQTKARTANNSRPVSPIKLPSSPKPMRVSPQQAASSPLRAAKSPERTLQVHKITPKGREAQLIFDAPSPDMADSPSKPASNQVAAAEADIGVDGDITMQDAESAGPEGSQEDIAAPSSFAFTLANGASRRVSMESGSTDELASPDKAYAPTPLRKNGAASQDFGTPSTAARGAVIEASHDVSFTPLVGKLGGWAASSPNKQAKAKASRQTRGMFSLGGAAAAALKEESPLKHTSPVKTAFFEDQLAAMEHELDHAQDVIDAGFEIVANGEAARIALQSSMDSQASEEYGDENTAPTEAEMLREEQDNDHTMTCTPAKVFTPPKAITQRPPEVHTISKVPLRASAEDSPLKVPRQRSKSMGGPLSTVHEIKAATQAAAGEPLLTQPDTPKLAATVISQTPSSGMKLDAETPGRTVRRGVVPDVLKGAIVYVDVHTTEGADASGIFVDLLSQMGARCVKQWTWNPRANMVSSLDSAAPLPDDSPCSSPSTGRVGITHVVYKDGGKRTLEKVRQSNGVVLCVGVGWVLDCEREDKWLDEADYAIDTTIVPRGGGRRRKSMEPRALAKLGGNLIPSGSEMAQTPAKSNVSATKEFLTFNTPVSRRETFVIKPIAQTAEDYPSAVLEAPSTPLVAFTDGDDAIEDGDEPSTPYYLNKDAQLIQRTCPPKQGGEMLFPIKESDDEHVKSKLLEARRKSMAFISKTRSPLGRTVSYGGEKNL